MTRPLRKKWKIVALLLLPLFLVSCGGGATEVVQMVTGGIALLGAAIFLSLQ
jgi:hypothetical protein